MQGCAATVCLIDTEFLRLWKTKIVTDMEIQFDCPALLDATKSYMLSL